MAQNIVVLTLNEETFNKLKYFYADKQVANPNEYIIFMAKTEACSVTVYYTMNTVFQGKGAEDEAAIFGYNPNKTWLYNASHGGSDEVGTGDYFGPIIVAAAYVSAKDIPSLNACGIGDSKKLSDAFILDLVPTLIKQYKYSVLILDNSKYNQLIKKGWNMNSLKAALHNKALATLNKKVGKIPFFVIDQFTPKDKYYQYIKDEKDIVKNVEFITKGESASPAVALASMIARYTFLKMMQKMEEELGIKIPLGASSQVEAFVAEFIKKNGEEKLTNYAKVNFKTTVKAKELLNDKLV